MRKITNLSQDAAQPLDLILATQKRDYSFVARSQCLARLMDAVLKIVAH